MKSNVFFGVLTGVAIGTIIGILFAPEKGSVTRNEIARKGDEYADELKERFNGVVENLLQKVENNLRRMQRETERVESEIKVEGM